MSDLKFTGLTIDKNIIIDNLMEKYSFPMFTDYTTEISNIRVMHDTKRKIKKRFHDNWTFVIKYTKHANEIINMIDNISSCISGRAEFTKIQNDNQYIVIFCFELDTDAVYADLAI